MNIKQFFSKLFNIYPFSKPVAPESDVNTSDWVRWASKLNKEQNELKRPAHSTQSPRRANPTNRNNNSRSDTWYDDTASRSILLNSDNTSSSSSSSSSKSSYGSYGVSHSDNSSYGSSSHSSYDSSSSCDSSSSDSGGSCGGGD